MTRVGLVLGGGGVAGYGFHTGALAALETASGWDPREADVIVGTSSGSIVAALLRAGLSTDELKARATLTGPELDVDGSLDAVAGPGAFRLPRVWRGLGALSLVTSEIRRGRRLRPSNVVLGALPEGRVPTEPLRAVIEPFLGPTWPERDLWIPTTELSTGRRLVLGRDDVDAYGVDVTVDVATAVEASCAIPGYFTPVDIGGQQYVDGGMRSPDNTDVLVGVDLDVVIVSSPLSIGRVDLRGSPLLSTLRAYPRRRLAINVARLRATGVQVLVVEPEGSISDLMGINAMDADRLTPVMEASESVIAQRLDAAEAGAILDLLRP